MRSHLNQKFIAYLAMLLTAGVAQPQVTTFTRWFGGPKYDEAFCVRQLRDGGYILVGTSLTLTNAGNEVYAIRMTGSGDTLWTRTIGGRNDDDGFSVCQTFDGGFAIAGTKSSRPADTISGYFVKLDPTGAVEWTKQLRPSLRDRALSICETRDSGLAVAGVMGTGPYGRSDAWLVRMDRHGDTLWTRTYGGAADDGVQDILLLPDNGFLLTGYTNSFGDGTFACYAIRTNAVGDTLWTRCYGGPDDETGWSADAVGDSGFVVGGVVAHGVPPARTSRFFLIRMAGNGDTVWTKTLDAATNDSRFCVRHTRDGGFAYVGTAIVPGKQEDALLVKTDRWGEAQWWRSFGTLSLDYGSFLQQCADGGYAIAGLVSSENTYDAYIVKTDENGMVTSVDEGTHPSVPVLLSLSQNWPNPFNPTTEVGFWIGEGGFVSLKVFDVLGREVRTLVNEVKRPGTYTVRFDGSALAGGVYFYRLEARPTTSEGQGQAGSFVCVKKLLLLK